MQFHIHVVTLSVILLITAFSFLPMVASNVGLSTIMLTSSSTSMPASEISLAADSLHEDLTGQLSLCKSGDEIFRICELLPAIRGSNDKARKVIVATKEDAHVAVHAIYKLANITKYNTIEANTWTNDILETDRRFLQLQDCVELKVAEIHLSDVNKYLRSLITLKMDDDDHFKLLLPHYSRISNESFIDEIVDAFWSLALYKDTFNHKIDVGLISNMTSYISDLVDKQTVTKYPFLHPSLSVKLIWSLAVYGVNDEKLVSFATSSLNRNIKYMSPSKCLNLFWALAKLKRFKDSDASGLLLNRIISDVRLLAYNPTDIGLISHSLVTLHSEIQRYPLHENIQICEPYVKTLGELLVQNAINQHPPDVSSLSQVLRVGARLNLTTTQLWDKVQIVLSETFRQNISVKCTDAAFLLEGLALAFPCDVLFPSDEELTISIPRELLHIAGRLSVICATNSTKLDLSSLINACWAIAELGYPSQRLLREVRKRVQFKLDELSPSGLTRLIESIYIEDLVSLDVFHFKGVGAKFDRDFVNQVLSTVIRRFNDIPLLTERVRVLISAASLGRIAVFGNSSHQLRLPIDKMGSLSTRMLVNLLWSISRLKRNLIDDSSLEALKLELSRRILFDMDFSAYEALLLVRSLCNVRACNDDSFKELHAPAASLLLKHLLAGEEETVEDEPSDISPRLAFLRESLQSFLDLEWYHDDVLALMSKYIDVCAINEVISYNVGRIEGALAMYRLLPLDQQQPTTLKKARSFLSKFFQ
jgi:hypothetical protein